MMSVEGMPVLNSEIGIVDYIPMLGASGMMNVDWNPPGLRGGAKEDVDLGASGITNVG
jgi:hypothetical protein